MVRVCRLVVYKCGGYVGFIRRGIGSGRQRVDMCRDSVDIFRGGVGMFRGGVYGCRHVVLLIEKK